MKEGSLAYTLFYSVGSKKFPLVKQFKKFFPFKEGKIDVLWNLLTRICIF
jgi:hypothetical protein